MNSARFARAGSRRAAMEPATARGRGVRTAHGPAAGPGRDHGGFAGRLVRTAATTSSYRWGPAALRSQACSTDLVDRGDRCARLRAQWPHRVAAAVRAVQPRRRRRTVEHCARYLGGNPRALQRARPVPRAAEDLAAADRAAAHRPRAGRRIRQPRAGWTARPARRGSTLIRQRAASLDRGRAARSSQRAAARRDSMAKVLFILALSITASADPGCRGSSSGAGCTWVLRAGGRLGRQAREVADGRLEPRIRYPGPPEFVAPGRDVETMRSGRRGTRPRRGVRDELVARGAELPGRTPTSSSSPTSPRTTCPNHCARSRTSASCSSGSTPPSWTTRRAPVHRFRRRRCKADAGADHRPTGVLAGRTHDRGVRRRSTPARR